MLRTTVLWHQGRGSPWTRGRSELLAGTSHSGTRSASSPATPSCTVSAPEAPAAGPNYSSSLCLCSHCREVWKVSPPLCLSPPPPAPALARYSHSRGRAAQAITERGWPQELSLLLNLVLASANDLGQSTTSVSLGSHL